MEALGVAPAGGRVRFRPAANERVPVLIGLACLMAFAVWSWLRIHDPVGLVFPPLFGLEFGYITWVLGITLTADEAIVHRGRRRRIRWRDVQFIQIEKSTWNSRVIVIYEASGRRTRLRAPISNPPFRDKDFERKFHVIGEWWLEHRGADWVPDDAPRRGWGQPEWSLETSRGRRRGRIRPASMQTTMIIMMLADVLFSAIAGTFAIPSSGDVTVLSVVAGVLAAAVVGSALCHFGLSAGVSLTDETLKAHNLRPRTIRWADVVSLSAERTWHGTRLVVRENSGRRTRLASPRVGLLLWDDDFRQKAEAIEARRRAAVAGDSEPIAALDLTAAALRPAAVWKKVIVGIACVALGYELALWTLVMLAMVVTSS